MWPRFFSMTSLSSGGGTRVPEITKTRIPRGLLSRNRGHYERCAIRAGGERIGPIRKIAGEVLAGGVERYPCAEDPRARPAGLRRWWRGVPGSARTHPQRLCLPRSSALLSGWRRGSPRGPPPHPAGGDIRHVLRTSWRDALPKPRMEPPGVPVRTASRKLLTCVTVVSLPLGATKSLILFVLVIEHRSARQLRPQVTAFTLDDHPRLQAAERAGWLFAFGQAANLAQDRRGPGVQEGDVGVGSLAVIIKQEAAPDAQRVTCRP